MDVSFIFDQMMQKDFVFSTHTFSWVPKSNGDICTPFGSQETKSFSPIAEAQMESVPSP